MTLDEAIKYIEAAAEEQEKAAKEWHENQVRKCDLFPFTEMDYTHENECKKHAEELRQFAEYFKELKKLKGQTRLIPKKDMQFVPIELEFQGRKGNGFLYKPQQIIITQYITLEAFEHFGGKYKETRQ